MGKPSLRIQAVLYQTGKDELHRSFSAINNAARTSAGRFSSVTLALGDASPEPLFTSAAEIKLLLPHVDAVTYTFFNQNTGYGLGHNILAGIDAGNNGRDDRNDRDDSINRDDDVDADLLLLMNPEILLSPNALTVLVEPLLKNDAGLTEARQLPVEHPKAYDKITGDTEWVSGACCMIPVRLFRRLGGFDTNTFFMYCEDVDLSWRVKSEGYRLVYCPDAPVFHARRLSGKGKNMASSTEQRWSILAEALLAYKWGYPQWARQRLALAVQRGDAGAEEAQNIFTEREQAGALPLMQDPEHMVTHIRFFPETGGLLFATHRFDL